MTYVINGPSNGYGVILGNSSGDDIINAFANGNMVFSEGANDTINLLGSLNYVDLGAFTGVTDAVNVGGNSNMIIGNLTASDVNINGGTGNTTVTLTNMGGVTNVSLGGYFNSITLNADAANTIVTGAGNATVAVGNFGADADQGQGWYTHITLAGTSNTVTGSDQNTYVHGGLGYDTISLEDGNDVIRESGHKNNITVGSGFDKIWAGNGSDTVTITEGDLGGDDPGTPVPTDSVYLKGTDNTVTMADEDVNVSGGTGSGTFTEVVVPTSGEYPTPGNNGNDTITTSGSHNKVTLLDGNDTVSITGTGGNKVTLGNGNDSVTVSGANNKITVGDGADTVTALGGGNSITAGNGSGPAGPDTITVGANATVTGTDLAAGTVINSVYSNNTVNLWDNSSATVNDEPTGSGLFLEMNGTASDYTGKVTVTGFGNDLLNGRIDFDNLNGANGASLDVGANPANLANVFANMTSDGHGGDLIKLAGGGSLDLAGTTSVSVHTFV